MQDFLGIWACHAPRSLKRRARPRLRLRLDPGKPLVFAVAALAIHLTLPATSFAQPVIEIPPLVYRGWSAGPVTIEVPSLVYRGYPSGPVSVEVPAIIYRGNSSGPAVLETPALIYTGRAMGLVVIETPALVYAGNTLTGTAAQRPTYELEYLDPPMGPVSSTYLSLDNQTVDVATDIQFQYHGLPDRSGFGGLFYVGGGIPKHVAWFYTSPEKPDGEYKRSADSLPHYTGDWKVCIGLPPNVQTNDPDILKYDDCLDFVLAGPGSIGVHPIISVPREVLVNQPTELRYAGMPPCNCEISVVDMAGKVVAKVLTNRQANGAMVLKLEQPGSYELRIYYHGQALRARMKLEVN